MKVTLYTLNYAILFIPDFEKLSEVLATGFNEDIDTITKIVKETINGFYDVAGIDLNDFYEMEYHKIFFVKPGK